MLSLSPQINKPASQLPSLFALPPGPFQAPLMASLTSRNFYIPPPPTGGLVFLWSLGPKLPMTDELFLPGCPGSNSKWKHPKPNSLSLFIPHTFLFFVLGSGTFILPSRLDILLPHSPLLARTVKAS